MSRYSLFISISILCAIMGLACRKDPIVAETMIPLYQDMSSCENVVKMRSPSPPMVGQLSKGELASIVGIEYGKDAMCFRVRRGDGSIGYMVGPGEHNFRYLSSDSSR